MMQIGNQTLPEKHSSIYQKKAHNLTIFLKVLFTENNKSLGDSPQLEISGGGMFSYVVKLRGKRQGDINSMYEVSDTENNLRRYTMAGRPIIQDHYKSCLPKQRKTIFIDQETVFWLTRLAQMEKASGGELDTFSKHVRNALHMYLKYRVPSLYRMTDEHFIMSNERTGKLYNGHRY